MLKVLNIVSTTDDTPACNGFRWPLFLYLHQQFTVLLIIFLHWTQLLEYWTHNGITCYEKFREMTTDGAALHHNISINWSREPPIVSSSIM